MKEGIISLFTTLWFTPPTSTYNSTTSSASSVNQLLPLPVSATTTSTTNTTTSKTVTTTASNTTNSNSKVGSSGVTPRRLTRGRAGAGVTEDEEVEIGML